MQWSALRHILGSHHAFRGWWRFHGGCGASSSALRNSISISIAPNITIYNNFSLWRILRTWIFLVVCVFSLLSRQPEHRNRFSFLIGWVCRSKRWFAGHLWALITFSNTVSASRIAVLLDRQLAAYFPLGVCLAAIAIHVHKDCTELPQHTHLFVDGVMHTNNNPGTV